MRKLTITVLLATILAMTTAAQTVRVVATVKEKQPIPYAHAYVRLPGTGALDGTVTDTQGRFALPHIQDTLYISCVGYQRRAIPLHLVPSDTIFLEESETLLPAVDITAQTAEQFMQRCISAVKANSSPAYFRNSGFHWRTLMVDSLYRRVTTQRITSEQYYSGDQITRNFKIDSTHLIRGNGFWAEIPAYDTIDDYLYFDLVKNGPSILDTNFISEWNLRYEYDDRIDPNSITIIQANSRGKMENNYRFYVDNEDLSIRKVEFVYQWPTRTPGSNILSNSRGSARLRADSSEFILKTITGVLLYEKTKLKYNLKYFHCSIAYEQHIRMTPSQPVQVHKARIISEYVVHEAQEYPAPQLAAQLFNSHKKTIAVDRSELDRAIAALGRTP